MLLNTLLGPLILCLLHTSFVLCAPAAAAAAGRAIAPGARRLVARSAPHGRLVHKRAAHSSTSTTTTTPTPTPTPTPTTSTTSTAKPGKDKKKKKKRKKADNDATTQQPKLADTNSTTTHAPIAGTSTRAPPASKEDEICVKLGRDLIWCKEPYRKLWPTVANSVSMLIASYMNFEKSMRLMQGKYAPLRQLADFDVFLSIFQTSLPSSLASPELVYYDEEADRYLDRWVRDEQNKILGRPLWD